MVVRNAKFCVIKPRIAAARSTSSFGRIIENAASGHKDTSKRRENLSCAYAAIAHRLEVLHSAQASFIEIFYLPEFYCDPIPASAVPSPSPAALHFTATARGRGKTASMTAEEGSIQVIGLPRCCTGAAALDKGRVAVGSLGGGACSVDLGTGQTLSS